MIDFPTTSNFIRFGLQTYLREKYEGILVIEFSPGVPQPAMPYLTMNFTSPLIPGKVEIVWQRDSESGIEYARYSHDTMVASWNVYHDDTDEAHEIALKALRWFVYDGRDYLKQEDFVVADFTGIQNRDIYVVNAWERRLGFDVTFRVLSEVAGVLDSIETADIQHKERDEG